jgi:hypothetical protein
MCDWVQWSPHPKLSSYISFSDLQSSRFALSYIQESNPNAFSIQVAFIALDAENLGELVNDKYHTDFGDNKFPYYRGNTNVRLDYKKFKVSEVDEDESDESDDESDGGSDIDEDEAINKYIPHSILNYLRRK